MSENNCNEIKKIVLTGGPCAGKTTIFNIVADDLRKKGYYVITIGETASELINSKILPSSDKEHTLMFQDMVLKQQYTKEKNAEEYAKKMSKTNKVIILYDRGIMDNRAYLDSQEDFELILEKNNLDELSVLNNYDLVINLLSTASYKKDSYELNETRSETIEEAEEIDKKTSMAWMHHNNLEVIKPTETIEEKIETVSNIIDKYLSNQYYQQKDLIKLDNSSNISVYDTNNSKTIDNINIHFENGMTIKRKNYRNSVIYMCDNKTISSDCFNKLMHNNKVLCTSTIKEIIFFKNGKIYKINSHNDELYLEYNNAISLDLPINLNLQREKSLVKIRKNDNI